MSVKYIKFYTNYSIFCLICKKEVFGDYYIIYKPSIPNTNNRYCYNCTCLSVRISKNVINILNNKGIRIK